MNRTLFGALITTRSQHPVPFPIGAGPVCMGLFLPLICCPSIHLLHGYILFNFNTVNFDFLKCFSSVFKEGGVTGAVIVRLENKWQNSLMFKGKLQIHFKEKKSFIDNLKKKKKKKLHEISGLNNIVSIFAQFAFNSMVWPMHLILYSLLF